MNTQNLPKSFAIKCEAFNTEQLIVWDKFISYMNSLDLLNSFSGDSLGDYYIVDNGDCRISGQLSDVPIIMLQHFNDLTSVPIVEEEQEEEQEEVEMTMCFDDELYPSDECREFSEYSRYEGQFYHESHYRAGEVVYCEYGDFRAHRDEVSVCSGDYFITETEDDYNITWSEYDNTYLCTDDEYVHYGIYNDRGCECWFYSEDYVYFDGSYYVDASVAESNGLWYDDDTDEWVAEDRRAVKRNNATYHDMDRKSRFDRSPKFSIGFEIEKEDEDAGLINYQDLYDSTNGWIKESDNSLNHNGYELVSPAFDLYSDLLDKEINSSRDLITLINAGTSSRCGGHINVASSEYTPDQLFEGLSGFLPLIYSMYPHRINVDYSKAKKKHEYYNKTKFSAVFIKPQLIEFRIFSGVKSIDNLLWRRDLIRIMCDNINKSEKEVLRMLVSPNSKLHKHLRKVYNHEGLVDKVMKFVDHSAYYNNKKIESVSIDAIKKTSTGITMSTSDELAC